MKCKYAIVDEKLKAEAEELDRLYEQFSPSEEELLAFMEANGPQEPSPLDDCEPYCKFCKSGTGHPGEHMIYCDAPGNEHVLDYEFRLSEVI